MSWGGFGVRDVHQLHHFSRELVYELLAPVGMDLGRYSKFAEPFFENGVGDCFCIFILDRCDYSVFSKSISDAQNEFLAAVSGQHGPE